MCNLSEDSVPYVLNKLLSIVYMHYCNVTSYNFIIITFLCTLFVLTPLVEISNENRVFSLVLENIQGNINCPFLYLV